MRVRCAVVSVVWPYDGRISRVRPLERASFAHCRIIIFHFGVVHVHGSSAEPDESAEEASCASNPVDIF